MNSGSDWGNSVILHAVPRIGRDHEAGNSCSDMSSGTSAHIIYHSHNHNNNDKSSLGTNLINDFMATTFSMKLGIICEKLTLL